MNMDDIRQLPAEHKYVFLGIRAEDTPRNAEIHRAFREMAAVECKNDRTLALAKLLEYYQADGKIEALWDKIKDLEYRIGELEAEKVKKNDKKEMF